MEDILIKEKATMEDTLVKEEVLPQPEVGKAKAEKPKHKIAEIFKVIEIFLPLVAILGIFVFIIGGAVVSKGEAISDCIKDSSGSACAEHKAPSESVSPTVETDFRE